MSVDAAHRSYMATLTGGWRFTLPIALRESKGWAEGARLVASARGGALTLEAMAEEPDDGSAAGAPAVAAPVADSLPSPGNDADYHTEGLQPQPLLDSVRDGPGESVNAIPTSCAEIYLGAGGKLIVPVPLRKGLGWTPGKKVLVSDDGDGTITVRPCCSVTKCRSCGRIEDVREVLPNVYLCADCWEKYVNDVRQEARRAFLDRGLSRVRANQLG